eukprot:SAG31_NODE_2197_length_6216_cov_4.189962_1_plen_86_part_00
MRNRYSVGTRATRRPPPPPPRLHVPTAHGHGAWHTTPSADLPPAVDWAPRHDVAPNAAAASEGADTARRRRRDHGDSAAGVLMSC